MQDLLIANVPSFMESLSPRLRNQILRAGTHIRYRSGELIHNRGDAKPGVSIVMSGVVQIGVYGADGSFVITSFLGAGQTFGEFTMFAGLPRTHDAIASGPTVVNQIQSSAFAKLYASEPEISHALLSTTLIRLHGLIEILDAVRRLPMRERIAKVLFVLMQAADESERFQCRQSDLAFTLGVSRTSLSTALKQLSQLGLIETGYGEIRVPDPDKLRNWVAEHCSP